MTIRIVERIKRDPGGALVVLASMLVVLLYAPTIGRGLVNYDDTWLVRDNYLLKELSLHNLHTIFFDTRPETRFVLGAEYLPVRDLSVLIDHALFGDWYGGYHAVNVALYLISIWIWFAALVELGLDRRLVGLAILLWAIHPAHAESVAWLSERKGLLSIVLSGATVLSYLKFRAGRPARWIVLACVCAMAAVWSKAPSAFIIASLAPLELFAPAKRHSLRRVLVGLGAIAVVCGAAFVPVIVTATRLEVVGASEHVPGGALEMTLGLHGFYLALAVMAFPSAISYPIVSVGPSTAELVVGSVGLLTVLAIVLVPRWRGRKSVPSALRIGGVIWLAGWLPVSRILLPMKAVLAADRYILFGSLGVALSAAFVLHLIASSRARTALTVDVVLAAGMRTLDAQSNWRDTLTLWRRAVESNPNDGEAWGFYAEAAGDTGPSELEFAIVVEGLKHTNSPRLILREALLVLEHGKRHEAVELMRRAADAGEPRAMANLALLLHADGKSEEALTWARKVTQRSRLYFKGWRTLGAIELSLKHFEEARAAFQRAYELRPIDIANRFDLALALIALHQPELARPHLEACLADPLLAPQAQSRLDRIGR